MVSVLKESSDSSPTLALSRDGVIYISDDAASDIDDAFYKAFNKSLPLIQAIV